MMRRRLTNVCDTRLLFATSGSCIARYHFRKIDPWLRGQCTSWHPEYNDEFWRKKWGGGPKGGKYSVFALSEGSQEVQGEAADVD